MTFCGRDLRSMTGSALCRTQQEVQNRKLTKKDKKGKKKREWKWSTAKLSTLFQVNSDNTITISSFPNQFSLL